MCGYLQKKLYLCRLKRVYIRKVENFYIQNSYEKCIEVFIDRIGGSLCRIV